MKKWKVSLKLEENEKNLVELIDAKEILDGYLNINRNFYVELLNIAKIINRYMIGKGIEFVIDPNGKD